MNDIVKEILKKADELDSKEKYDDAISLYDKLIHSGHKEARIFALRGYSKFKAKYYKRSINDFNKAIAIKDNVPTTYFYRARSKEEIGDLNGALEDYQKSAELDYDKSDVHINMGMIYEYLGDLGKAENEFRIVLRLDSTNKIAIESLKELKKNKMEKTKG
jgi:tetratricopeptide (TPR) repeat protein